MGIDQPDGGLARVTIQARAIGTILVVLPQKSSMNAHWMISSSSSMGACKKGGEYEDRRFDFPEEFPPVNNHGRRCRGFGLASPFVLGRRYT
jgi:hypothetical protein